LSSVVDFINASHGPSRQLVGNQESFYIGGKPPFRMPFVSRLALVICLVGWTLPQLDATCLAFAGSEPKLLRDGCMFCH
ncbi:hypothetical protein AAVH_43139, partial [Aphelenchoides avenae]